jgi:tryptophanyl-tRNA synthetase
MAADILLYQADKVPVGEDQKQHLELTRDIVNRFNHQFAKKAPVLKLPDPLIRKEGARVMSLTDGTRKMSKSDPKGDVFLKDDPALIKKKIMGAVTDSEAIVKYDSEKKPGVSNLLTILSALSGTPIADLEIKFKGSNYGTFKSAVAEEVLNHLVPLQTKQQTLTQSGYLQDVLKQGALKANQTSQLTLQRVKRAVGLPL